MRIVNIVPFVSKLAEGQFMGGWINASPTTEENYLEYKYSTSWISSDSGYERGCSQEDIDLNHKSQEQLDSLTKTFNFTDNFIYFN